jgi:hypothetical protein
MSLVKLLPAWFHAIADAESGLAAFYVVMGVAVLAVSLVTNYQYGPKRHQGGLGASRPVTA